METTDTNANVDNLGVVETAFMEIAIRLTESGISPLVSAAVMAKLSLMIYRSTLSEEEFHKMVDTISESREMIMTLEDYSAVASAKSKLN